MSYLEAKYLLLLHYCMHLVFYILLKAEGRPVRDHPVIARLVEIRAFLEKARPIDKRLRYQMDKLLHAVATVKVTLPENTTSAVQPTSALAQRGALVPLRMSPAHQKTHDDQSSQLYCLRSIGIGRYPIWHAAPCRCGALASGSC